MEAMHFDQEVLLQITLRKDRGWREVFAADD